MRVFRPAMLGLVLGVTSSWSAPAPPTSEVVVNAPQSKPWCKSSARPAADAGVDIVVKGKVISVRSEPIPNIRIRLSRGHAQWDGIAIEEGGVDTVVTDRAGEFTLIGRGIEYGALQVWSKEYDMAGAVFGPGDHCVTIMLTRP